MTPDFEAVDLKIPSRYDNPFASCWTKPGAIPFHFPPGQSPASLISTLAHYHWRGAIVGPHGSGKTTLLESLKPALAAAGCEIESFALRDQQRQVPNIKFQESRPSMRRLLIVDGYEQLSWLERARLFRESRRGSAGLLVTSHRKTRLRTIIRLAPTRELVQRLVDQLCDDISPRVQHADVAASLACHGSNVRNVFFDLYDRHERLRRQRGTFDLAHA